MLQTAKAKYAATGARKSCGKTIEFDQNPLQLSSRGKLGAGVLFQKHVEHPADHTAAMPKWQAVMALMYYKWTHAYLLAWCLVSCYHMDLAWMVVHAAAVNSSM